MCKQSPQHCLTPESKLPVPLQDKSHTAASVHQCRNREHYWYPRSHMSCQIHATRSVQDSRGMNYCPVAMATPCMQKTPCCGLKNGDLWDFIFKTISATREEREENVKWREKRLQWEKAGGRREAGWGFARSNLQQCFRQFGSLLSPHFYKVSRNTSSAIHFISIPTPASHLHSVSFTSPFHFSACHYISWMITYWQFLHWQSTGQDTTPPASKAGRSGERFPSLVFLSSFFASTVPVLLSCFHWHPPPQLLIRSRSVPYDPYKPLQGLVTPRGSGARSYVLTLRSHKWTRCSVAGLIGCHEIYGIIPNSGAPQATALSYRSIAGTLHQRERAAVPIQAALIKFQTC